MTAVWTPPRTWAVGELATAAMLNSHIRDNLDWLKTPPQAVTSLTNSMSITSTAFVDVVSLNLTTAGGAIQASWMVGVALGALGNFGQFALLVDGVMQPGVVMQHCMEPNYMELISFCWYVAPKPAGAHTLTLRAAVSTGGLLTIYGTAYGTVAQFWAREI